MNLLCSVDRRVIEARLGVLLDRIFAPEEAAPLRDAVRAFVLTGGKRLRPQLCLWTYRQIKPDNPSIRRHPAKASRDTLPDALLDAACVWELFHAFLLVHDDIIDAAEARRDRPSLHRALASLDGGCRRFGTNLAIVVGDLLFGGCMGVLHDLDLPPRHYRDNLRLFSRVACVTGFGQAIDICQSHAPLSAVREQTLLRGYHWKTAAYTFEGPMLCGALVAGVDDPAALDALSRFALSLGQAYQLHNDLIDLSAAAHPGCDLVQGKRTVTLVRARSAMGDAARRRFDEQVEALRTANGSAVAQAELLRQELHELGAVERTRRLIRQFLDDAREAADRPALPSRLGGAMSGLLHELGSAYFLPPVAEAHATAAAEEPQPEPVAP